MSGRYEVPAEADGVVVPTDLGAVALGVSTLVQQVEDIERLWGEDPTSGHVLVMLRELRGCITGWMEVLRARA